MVLEVARPILFIIYQTGRYGALPISVRASERPIRMLLASLALFWTNLFCDKQLEDGTRRDCDLSCGELSWRRAGSELSSLSGRDGEGGGGGRGCRRFARGAASGGGRGRRGGPRRIPRVVPFRQRKQHRQRL